MRLRKAHSQTTEQLDRARTTVAQHTTDIAHIESKLEECESTDEESSYSEESGDLEPGAQDPPTATPQGHEEEEDPHNIEMEDVGNDPIPPPPSEQDDDPLPVPAQAVQSDPPHGGEEDWEGVRDNRDVIVKDQRIVIEAGGTTQITLAEDQLLDDQGGTGAETPSGALAELLSQMTGIHPLLCKWQVILPMKARMPEEEPPAPTNNFHHESRSRTNSLWRQALPPPVRRWKKEEQNLEPLQ